MKKKGVLIFICILMALFILMPFPASGISIRLYLDEFEGENIWMYYTTEANPNLGNDQRVTAVVDRENKLALFRLPPETARQLTLIRFDFPNIDQVLSIQDVSVSSGGIIRHDYSPCDFFADANILYLNSIPEISLVLPKRTAYFRTVSENPYLILSPALVSDIRRYQSSYRLSRLAACLLIILGYLLYRKNFFGEGENTNIPL